MKYTDIIYSHTKMPTKVEQWVGEYGQVFDSYKKAIEFNILYAGFIKHINNEMDNNDFVAFVEFLAEFVKDDEK